MTSDLFYPHAHGTVAQAGFQLVQSHEWHSRRPRADPVAAGVCSKVTWPLPASRPSFAVLRNGLRNWFPSARSGDLRYGDRRHDDRRYESRRLYRGQDSGRTPLLEQSPGGRCPLDVRRSAPSPSRSRSPLGGDLIAAAVRARRRKTKIARTALSAAPKRSHGKPLMPMPSYAPCDPRFYY